MVYELTYGKHKGCLVQVIKKNGTACQVCTTDEAREIFWCKTDALRVRNIPEETQSRYAFDRVAR